ncbi:hypothetical protein CPB83DRAFT_897469 [Crepidotus variabilis]|uniref:Cation-transporting P-type ATPase N-terminal domain-containing protein n=1 Tax=Crepidotus variabilis TaxID=179855 RepID=A0A9P6JLJ6_9AGAR|nr:hypothetical protein CPB83DRAFT_897469 [Crepidotus variabilis]
MLSPSSPKATFDEEAQKAPEQVEFVETSPDAHGISYTETRTPHARRLPIEYRTLSVHVETKVQEDERVEKGKKKEDTRKQAVKGFSNLEWPKIFVDEALSRLAVSPKTGLEQAQAQRRQLLNGKNTITPPKSNLWKKVLEWVLGGFGSLLLAASIVCFIAWKPLGNPNPNASNLALAIVLLIVLLVQAVFNAWQDFSTSRVMSSIKGMLPSDVLVLRDSAQTKIPAKELVPGDLITIGMGEKIPADLRLIDVSSDLQFDRSILTGESEPVSGRINLTDDNFLETRNIALQGTLCVAGSGTGLVIQTGDKTVFGVITKLSSMESSGLTTLQCELLRFVVIIASLATFVAVLIVVLWAAWRVLSFVGLRKLYPDYINVPTLLIDVVSVMVAFIPEGLPVAVTLSLAKVAHTPSKKKIVCKGGPPIPLGTRQLETITQIQESWSRQGQRVLLLARRIVQDEYLEKFANRQPEDYGDVVEDYINDFIVVRLVGLMDPLKPDIRQTVSVCRGAGIRFFIVSGDHPTTAASIAAQAGIVSDLSHVHHASVLIKRSDPDLKVYNSDSDVQLLKSIIITGSELITLTAEQVFKLGNVVAVTGDGVNDAPSLKAANCGIAMGECSDVAKEAADLVLLDVLYLLPAGSFSELMPIIFNVVFGLPQMLSNIHVIIICVATDVLPALSLCMEPPEHGLLLRKPRDVKTDRLANWRLLLQAYGFLDKSFWYLERNGVPFSDIILSFQTLPGPALPALTPEIFSKAQSIYFFTLVIMQWGNILATRGRRLCILQHTPLKNPYIFGAMPLTLLIAICFSYVPWFQRVFLTSGISVEYFFIPMFILG